MLKQLSLLLFVLTIICSCSKDDGIQLNPTLTTPEVSLVKTLGGSVNESGRSVINTIDGGYIVASFTQSIDGDIETTKKACAKFKHKPVSVMNFIEGTRFTDEKHQKQNADFANLLKPKAGGIGFVLSTMGESLNKVVNVTIYYPEGTPDFLDFLCGKIKEVQVVIEIKDIDEHLLGDYVNDRNYKISFQKWVNQLWVEKDQLLDQLKNNNR